MYLSSEHNAPMCALFFFFFQAEDGIRDYKVTGVQTCALPIYAPLPPGQADIADGLRCGAADAVEGSPRRGRLRRSRRPPRADGPWCLSPRAEIGRASCRERV